MPRSVKRTKNAHGLKLSKPARIIVKTGSVIFEVSTFPKTGRVIILSSCAGIFFLCGSFAYFFNWIRTALLDTKFYFIFKYTQTGMSLAVLLHFTSTDAFGSKGFVLTAREKR